MMDAMEAGRYLPICVRASDSGDIIEDLDKELMTTGSARERAEYPAEEDCVEIRDGSTALNYRTIQEYRGENNGWYVVW